MNYQLVMEQTARLIRQKSLFSTISSIRAVFFSIPHVVAGHSWGLEQNLNDGGKGSFAVWDVMLGVNGSLPFRRSKP
jgi:hypothetical protein